MALIDTAKIGKKGGEARAANLSDAELQKSASQAARARWDAYYKLHPEKLKAKKEREAQKARKGKSK
jgi:hypothetical protein